MTITKAELVQRLVGEVGLNHREAKEMVEAFFNEMSHALATGEEIKLANFGVFQTRTKPARPGRNPKTLAAVTISSRRVTTFHASASLKNSVAAIQAAEQVVLETNTKPDFY